MLRRRQTDGAAARCETATARLTTSYGMAPAAIEKGNIASDDKMTSSQRYVSPRLTLGSNQRGSRGCPDHRFSSSGTDEASRISVLRNINGNAEADSEEFSLRRNLVPLGLGRPRRIPATRKDFSRQRNLVPLGLRTRKAVVVTILARKRAGDLPHLYHYY